MTDDLNGRKKFYREHLKIRNNLLNWRIMNYAPIQCSRLYNQGLLDHFFSTSGQKDHEKEITLDEKYSKSRKGLWNILKSENFWNVVIITVGLLICGTLTGF